MQSCQKGFVGVIVTIIVAILVVGGTLFLVSIIYPNVLKNSPLSGLTNIFSFKNGSASTSIPQTAVEVSTKGVTPAPNSATPPPDPVIKVDKKVPYRSF